MSDKRLLFLAIIIGLLTVSCIPLQQRCPELESSLLKAQKALQSKDAKAYSLEIENKKLKNNLETCRKEHAELSKLKVRQKELERLNTHLSRKIDELSLDIKKKDSIIQIQGNVIGLLDDTKKTIETSLKEQISEKLIEIESKGDELKVTFANKILFHSGSVRINRKGEKLLLKMAKSLKEHKEQHIVVEGHTDSVPVGPMAKRGFPTNWELSATRAIAVVRFLQEKAGIQPERLSISAYSSYRPIASNKTKKGRYQNRRIEIILRASN